MREDITKKRYRDNWNVRDKYGGVHTFYKDKDQWQSRTPFYAKTGGTLDYIPTEKRWEVTDKEGKVIDKGSISKWDEAASKYMRRPESTRYEDEEEEE